MNDLISRQAVLKHIEKIRQSMQMMDDTHRANIVMTGTYLFDEAVRNQPTIDAVPVIRCKDCKHYAGDGKRCAWDICAFDNFYCYYGERKES